MPEEVNGTDRTGVETTHSMNLQNNARPNDEKSGALHNNARPNEPKSGTMHNNVIRNAGLSTTMSEEMLWGGA
jgi:hypothetical protein